MIRKLNCRTPLAFWSSGGSKFDSDTDTDFSVHHPSHPPGKLVLNMRGANRRHGQPQRPSNAQRTATFVSRLCNDVGGGTSAGETGIRRRSYSDRVWSLDTILAQCFNTKSDKPNEHYLIDFMDLAAISGLFMVVCDDEGNLKLISKKKASDGTTHKEPVFKFLGILVKMALLPLKPANEKEKKE